MIILWHSQRLGPKTYRNPQVYEPINAWTVFWFLWKLISVKSHLFPGNCLTLHANHLSTLVKFYLSLNEHGAELAGDLLRQFHQSVGCHSWAGGQSEAGSWVLPAPKAGAMGVLAILANACVVAPIRWEIPTAQAEPQRAVRQEILSLWVNRSSPRTTEQKNRVYNGMKSKKPLQFQPVPNPFTQLFLFPNKHNSCVWNLPTHFELSFPFSHCLEGGRWVNFGKIAPYPWLLNSLLKHRAALQPRCVHCVYVTTPTSQDTSPEGVGDIASVLDMRQKASKERNTTLLKAERPHTRMWCHTLGNQHPLREPKLTPGKQNTQCLVHPNRPPWEGLHITTLAISWEVLALQLCNVTLTPWPLRPCSGPSVGSVGPFCAWQGNTSRGCFSRRGRVCSNPVTSWHPNSLLLKA